MFYISNIYAKSYAVSLKLLANATTPELLNQALIFAVHYIILAITPILVYVIY